MTKQRTAASRNNLDLTGKEVLGLAAIATNWVRNSRGFRGSVDNFIVELSSQQIFGEEGKRREIGVYMLPHELLLIGHTIKRNESVGFDRIYYKAGDMVRKAPKDKLMTEKAAVKRIKELLRTKPSA